MKPVATAKNLADAYLIKHALDAEGIVASVRGEDLAGLAGQVPETDPTVWVEDSDVDRAVGVLTELRRGEAGGELDALVLVADALTRATPASDEERQQAMAELFVAAGRLARDPRRGDDIEAVYRLSAFVSETAPPFGMDADTWATIARLSVMVVNGASAEDYDGVQDGARAVRDFLRQYV